MGGLVSWLRAQVLASDCPGAATGGLEGIDVYDGQGAIDWPLVRDAGVTFAWIKATQGTYDVQSRFADDWEGARRAGLLRGAYHFFDPTEDGAAQAAAFLAVSGLAGAPAEGDLPPMLDLECPDGDPACLGTGQASGAGDLPPADIRLRVDAFLREVEVASSRRPIVYTFASYFASRGVDPAGLDRYPLFLAQPQPESGASSCLDVPAPWRRAAFWQYSWTGRVPGIAGAVDRDRFLGSASALAALAAPEVTRAADRAGDAGPVVEPEAGAGRSLVASSGAEPGCSAGQGFAPVEPGAGALGVAWSLVAVVARREKARLCTRPTSAKASRSRSTACRTPSSSTSSSSPGRGRRSPARASATWRRVP
jgi:lysozyme